MATPLDVIANLTGAGITEAQAKTWFTAMRAALAEAGDPMARYGAMQNLALAASVAGNALTIELKDRAGSDPSAASPCAVPFRNVTLATGDFSIINVTGATSLVVPDTALLGTVNSTPFRLWVVAFNDGGTFRLGVVNCRSSTSVMYLRDDLRYSSTAVGTGSDSAQVIYTGSGVTDKAMRILGYLEWSSGLATAGTWSGAPTKVQLFGPGVPLPGEIVQRAYTATASAATGSTVIPYDNSIPQNTEGTQFLTQGITPSSAANLVEVGYEGFFGGSIGSLAISAAVFKDSGADAIVAVAAQHDGAADDVYHLALRTRLLAAGTAAQTYKLRAGPNTAATITSGGRGGAALFGGAMTSCMWAEEIMA